MQILCDNVRLYYNVSQMSHWIVRDLVVRIHVANCTAWKEHGLLK